MAEGKSAFSVLDESVTPDMAKSLGIEASQIPGSQTNHVKRPKGNLGSITGIRQRAEAFEQELEREAVQNSQDTVVYRPEVVVQPQQTVQIQPTTNYVVKEEPLQHITVSPQETAEEEEKPFDMDDLFNKNDSVEEELTEDELNDIEDEDIDVPVPEDTSIQITAPKTEEKKDEIVDTAVYDENAVDIEITSTTIDDKEEEDNDLEQEVQTDSENGQDKLLISLQRQVTERLRPILRKRDVSGFTVATTPVGANAVVETKEVSVAKWPLSATGITVQARTLLGSDLEDLRTLMQQNDARGTLQKIYDAIVSPKPAFNVWTKSIAYADYDDLFMVLYIAAFKGSNYMPVDCEGEKCPEKTYITDDIPFGKMVKYKDEESKAKFQKLYKTLPAENYGITPTEIVPVAENYAIGFVMPSLYAMLLERDYYDSEFSRKYSTAIAVAPYIDRIYKIDYEAKKFVPIMHKLYDNNEAKTAKSRIVLINKILRTFNADEINALKAYMEAIGKDHKYIDYIMPATTCPHCGKENPESVTRASSLLFLRNQLAALVNTSKS